MDMLLDHVKDAYKHVEHAIEAKMVRAMDSCNWHLEHAAIRLEMFENDAGDFLKHKKNYGMTEESLVCLKMCLDGHLAMAEHTLKWAKHFCEYVEPNHPVEKKP